MVLPPATIGVTKSARGFTNFSVIAPLEAGVCRVFHFSQSYSKSRTHLRHAGRRDRYSAAVAVARDPAPIDAKAQQAGAHMTCEMVAAFCPVEAGSAEDAAARGVRKRR
jgi:hypothetical protein